jgi:hypothetical protein
MGHIWTVGYLFKKQLYSTSLGLDHNPETNNSEVHNPES